MHRHESHTRKGAEWGGAWQFQHPLWISTADLEHKLFQEIPGEQLKSKVRARGGGWWGDAWWRRESLMWGEKLEVKCWGNEVKERRKRKETGVQRFFFDIVWAHRGDADFPGFWESGDRGRWSCFVCMMFGVKVISIKERVLFIGFCIGLIIMLLFLFKNVKFIF